MREVTINGYNVSTYQLGVVGEHNATKLIVTPPSELINDRVSYYRCMFKLRNKAGPLVTPKYTSYPMEVMLVQALTLNSSFAMCIIAYDENGKYLAISKKIEGFYFNPSDYNALTDHIKEYLDDPLIDLQKILDGKADVTYVDTKCEELEEQLDNKADKDYIDGKLDSKVDKEEGKGLSSNDFTDELKAELETAYIA